MSDRITRVARGLVAATVAVFAAAFSHVVAGGGAPGAPGFALAAAFAVLVCVALAGRRLRMLTLAVSILSSQFVFHLLFEVGGGAAASASAPGGLHAAHAGHAGLDGYGALAAQLGASVADASGAAGHGHPAFVMWASHAVAAIVTIVALRRGEQTIARLRELGRTTPGTPGIGLLRPGRALARAFAAVIGRARIAGLAQSPARPAGHVRPMVAEAPDLLRDLLVVAGSLRHRGPPRSPRALLAHPA
ncbi:hypothetical protein N1028_04790 [Herbiconiux sp. CPCC 203407]|uniref:Uncharacterized protein n=1 Tax=Herbiconiux oxytropis TaxID=2970915 RepID=A0AA41XBL1_9MICO|nr:hypothetical protein [Herbiconiux oxytropis]MCS5722982.1 hypothetical protein [Herbiconiux oxytropis]MCS5725206.1 hypothetical protein [Herbiconiux oxytropis]